MGGTSRSRRKQRQRQVTDRRHPRKSPIGYTPGIRFTAAEERWMAERLGALERSQNEAPPAHKQGNIRRVGGLPEGFEEDAGAPPSEPGGLR